MGQAEEQKILNLFSENITGDILPRDMRTFVSSIFQAKENNVHRITNLNTIEQEIQKNDLVIITENGELNGLYVASKDDALFADLVNVTQDDVILNILREGQNGEVLGVQNNTLTWEKAKPIVTVGGSMKIWEILAMTPVLNTIYVATNDDLSSLVPGISGDGYLYSPAYGRWSNIGQIRGERGLQGQRGESSNIVGPQGPQ